MLSAFFENHYPVFFEAEHLARTQQLLETYRQAVTTFAPVFTDFVAPTYRMAFERGLSSAGEIRVIAFPQEGERTLLGFLPEYLTTDFVEPPLVLLETALDDRFEKIGHGDVLGSLMALGLTREKFGDILIGQGCCQVYVVEELADYVRSNLTQIRRSPADFRPVSLADVMEREVEGAPHRITVASTRLDAVLAAGFHLSRQKAQSAISSGHVKHNHFITTDQKTALVEGDLLSLRHHGRLAIDSIGGTTRKDRRVIRVRLMKR